MPISKYILTQKAIAEPLGDYTGLGGRTLTSAIVAKEVGEGSHLGRILGNGAAVTGKVFGLERVPVVKGQALPAYDPRAIQGIGVTYASSPMGADHTAGYAVAANLLGVGGQLVSISNKNHLNGQQHIFSITSSEKNL